MEERDAASPQQREAFIASQEGRDRTLEAMHVLERASARATPGRERSWLEDVTSALRDLEETVIAEVEESRRPDSLLSMIERDYHRRFGPRVRHLRELQEQVQRRARELREQLDRHASGEDGEVADLRDPIGRLTQLIRDHRALEGDLVYEAVTRDLAAPGRTDQQER